MSWWVEDMGRTLRPRWQVGRYGAKQQGDPIVIAAYPSRARAQKAAEGAAAAGEAEAKRLGHGAAGANNTVADAHLKLVALESTRLSASAINRDESLWRNHVEARWADRRWSSVRRAEVQAWVDDDLAPKLAPATVRHIVVLLSKCADRAVFHDWIAANPIAGVRSPQSTPPRPKALTEAEVDELLDEVDDNWWLLTAFLATTPVRPGEALGLEVRHLDPARNLVRIEQQWTERNGGELKLRTKTSGSTRWVPVQPSLMAELVASTSGAGPTDPVFVSEAGHRVSLGNYNKRVLGPAARRAGIGSITAYVLRHTAVTHLVERKHGQYHRKEIAAWAGHSDRTLADVYLRVGADFAGDELADMPDLVARRRGERDNVVPINRGRSDRR